MIILGIDPGVATIGFGVIRAERQKNTLIQYGVITTPPGIPLSNRLLQISNDMEELIRTFHPDEMAVEELFFTKNITTGIAVAHGRGVILLAAEKLGVPISVTAWCMASMTAGARGRVTSPMDSLMILASGWAAE